MKTQPTLLACTVTGASGTALSLTGAVTVIASPASGTVASGDVDGIGTAALFHSPQGSTTDGTSLYVSDRSNHKIRRIR